MKDLLEQKKAIKVGDSLELLPYNPYYKKNIYNLLDIRTYRDRKGATNEGD